jgi:PKD repeat protein
MKTLLLLILLLTSSSLSLFGQTKVWEATSPTTIDYLTISQDGSTLASFYKGSLYVWRKDSSSYIKLVTLNYNSPPIISKNNDTVYCLGIVNSINGIYAVPLHDDTVYFRPLKELPNNLNGGHFIINPTFRFLHPSQDSLSLIFGYSYTIITGTSTTYSRGRVGVLRVDGVQTKELIGEVVEQLSSNISTNYVIASGKSQDALQRSVPTVSPYTKVISLTTNKAVFSSTSFYKGISVCHDTNYIILDQSLYHLPTGDYVRNLATAETGNFHSCSDNYDFYITVKGDSLFVMRYDAETPFLTIHCEGKIVACQLSADSKRIVVLTNAKLLTVYNLPEVQPARLHVDFTSNYTSPYKGGSIQFRNNSYITDSKYRVLWEFGDGDTSSLLHPKHVYSTPGTYSVHLRIITASGDTSISRKINYINYLDVTKPVGSLWSKKYTNGGISALGFTNDSIFVGTNDGTLLSMNSSGNLGRFLVKNVLAYYSFPNENSNHINPLHFSGLACNEQTNELYAIGVPLGYSGYLKMYNYDLTKGTIGKYIDVGPPGYISEFVGGNTNYTESKDGGYSSIDFNSDFTHLHYSNYGNISYDWSNPPAGIYSDTRSSLGNYSGTLKISADEILYDNGYFPRTYFGLSFNPKFRDSAEKLANLNVYSIRGGLPYNPNSYFIIAKNNVHHIRYGTFNLIAKFPTKGTILRHSPDQYHSFTSDGVWSFADGKRLDSLPLLSARSFEVFPDGVHLLVMYPKSDTVAIFNTLNKKYMQYFKANYIISSIAISKDGKSFATGDTGGIVTLWQTPKLSITKKIEFISPQSDKNHVKGDTVQFFNTSIPVNSGCRYEWDFGDGTTSNERLPKHVYGKAGKYTVTLKTYCPSETGVDSTVDVLEKAAFISVTDTVTSVEGQEESALQSHLTIIPNPVIKQGLITVHFPHPEHYSLRIITLLGQEILLSADALSSHEAYAIPQLPRGVFTCQLRFGNGEIISQPFIVSE